MAASMLPRLLALAALVALLCAAVAVAQKPPAATGGAPVCDMVDQNVVNACYKSLAEERKIVDVVGPGKVNCCSTFQGHSCLCKMKAAWKAQGKTRQNNVDCVRDAVCN